MSLYYVVLNNFGISLTAISCEILNAVLYNNNNNNSNNNNNNNNNNNINTDLCSAKL